MHKLYANTTPFYIRDLSILGFWYLQVVGGNPGTNAPQIWTDDCMTYRGIRIIRRSQFLKRKIFNLISVDLNQKVCKLAAKYTTQ